MVIDNSRRQFIKLTSGAAAVAGLGSLWSGPLYAKDSLVVVEWGGAYVDSLKSLAAQQSMIDMTWELHSGGAAAILPKIKGTFPNTPYNLVASWSPVTKSMTKEGWLEPIDLKLVPNLADVADLFIQKDDQGRPINIPRGVGAMAWGYRPDTCPIEITSIEDLLSPKLKGLVMFPDPILNTNVQMITLARARGGDEFNMEPGWEFMKELARSGNIGRVAHSDAETVNSLTSGETCVTFSSQANFQQVAKNFPVVNLTKVPGDKGLKTAYFTESWVVLKGPKSRQAMEFANFTMSPENNEAFSANVGVIPANSKAKASSTLADVTMTPEELERFAFVPDWAYIGQQVDGWMKRWEQEIVPLL